MSHKTATDRLVEGVERLRSRDVVSSTSRNRRHTESATVDRYTEQARIRMVTPEPLDTETSSRSKTKESRKSKIRDEEYKTTKESMQSDSRRRSAHQRYADASSRLSMKRPSQQHIDASVPVHQAVRHRHSHREMKQLRPAAERTTSDSSNARTTAPIFGSPFTNDYANAMKEGRSRPRTHTLDDRRMLDEASRDSSPSGHFRRPRTRVGSVASTASGAYRVSEDTITSKGNQSALQSPLDQHIAGSSGQNTSGTDDQPTSRQRHSKSGRAKLSKPPPASISTSELNFPDPLELPIPPRAIPTVSPFKTLTLMQRTAGRMNGVLAFRRGETAPWSLAHCTIDDERGSLVYESQNEAKVYTTLITDLRSCSIRAAIDPEGSMPYMDVSPACSHIEIHLRPQTVEEFETWFAALLCWRPIVPKGVRDRKPKLQPGIIRIGRSRNGRRDSESSLKSKSSSVDGSVIKVGTMIMWDRVTSRKYPSSSKNGAHRSARRWRRVSGHLWEHGEFKIYMDQSTEVLYAIQLSRLSRWAVQRLDPTILDSDYSLAIYPQYTADCLAADVNYPIVLSFETRVLYEVWLVLLRAFTLPSLYGPPGVDTPEQAVSEASRTSFFRMDKTINVNVLAAQLQPSSGSTAEQAKHKARRPTSISKAVGFYVEVRLDDEVRARTGTKVGSTSPFWSDKFSFSETPSSLSLITIILKEQPDLQIISEKHSRIEAKRLFDATGPPYGGSSSGPGPSDVEIGSLSVFIEDLSHAEAMDDWYTLTDKSGRVTGRIQLSLKAEDKTILMAREYQPISELLHQFSNNLTMQIAQVLSQHINRVAECLLNIFQVSGKSGEWLMAMTEDEIDNAGDARDVSSVTSRLRFSKRLIGPLSANSSNLALGEMFEDRGALDRELFVRDASKNATQETNVLFRGNTLCTKSLDLHMRRLGHEYLQNVIGDKLKEIADKDPDCEVDPNKVEDRYSELEHNWKRLLIYTNDIWRAIAASATQCPPELRLIFRYIMGCADDRWGDHKRTVRYTSVSGFLFLRFFCPAILAPHLFGLIRAAPGPGARTTFKFIAKILQNLANMSTFGLKETWMEPANYFVTTNRQQFKDFIDAVCSIPADSETLNQVQPSYNTPIAILGRLSSGSQEGFASLPYLIDHPRSFADLVSLWTKGVNDSNMADILASDDADETVTPELLQFHRHCIALKQKEEDLFDLSEQADKPGKHMEEQWRDVLDELIGDNIFDQMAAFPEPPTPRDAVYGSPPSSSHQYHHPSSSRSSLPFRSSTSYAMNGHALKTTPVPVVSGGPASLSSSLSQYNPSSSTVDTGDAPRLMTAGSTDATRDVDEYVETLSPRPRTGGNLSEEERTALPGIGRLGTPSPADGKRRVKEGKDKSNKGLLGRFGKKK